MAGQVVAETTLPGWQVGYGYLDGKLLSQYRDSTTYFFQQDHLGSTRLLTRMDQSVYDSMDYLPYGELISGGNGSTHKFTGKERDAETGLDYFGARYYGNWLGRFLSADPIHFQAGMLRDPQRFNLYCYARGNPGLYVDPTGETIALSQNKKDREAELARWKHLAGQKGASDLREVRHKDGSWTLEIKKGKASDFKGIDGITSAMANLISDTQHTGKLDLVPAGTTVSDHADRIGGISNEIKIGPIPAETYKIGSQTPGITLKDADDGVIHWYVQEAGPYGQLPGEIMSNGKPGSLDGDILLGHEALGHGFDDTGASNQHAVAIENQVRQAKDPSAPTRSRHDLVQFPF
jgi:RHS repeat-associated protein